MKYYHEEEDVMHIMQETSKPSASSFSSLTQFDLESGRAPWEALEVSIEAQCWGGGT